MEQTGRCLGCMYKLSWDGKCTHCDFNLEKYHRKAHELMPGYILHDEFLIGRKIGEGGFGIVYIAWDMVLQITVVVKEWNSDNLNIEKNTEEFTDVLEKSKENFLHEARILSQISNVEGVVSVRRFFEEGDRVYLVMDYIEGISIKKYVSENGPLPKEKALGMLKRCVTALQKIHEKGLIHQDLSPDNFIINEEGNVTIIDFGTARYVNGMEEQTMTSVYKQGYTTLEQYSRNGKRGPWTDVYGCMATLYYMLTGTSLNEAVERVYDEEKDLGLLWQCAEFTEEEKQAIRDGLAVDYQKRIQNMKQLCDRLYGVEAGTQDKPVETKRMAEKVRPEENETLRKELEQLKQERWKKKGRWKKKMAVCMGICAVLVVMAGSFFVGEYGREQGTRTSVPDSHGYIPDTVSTHPVQSNGAEKSVETGEPKAGTVSEQTKKPKTKTKAIPEQTKKPKAKATPRKTKEPEKKAGKKAKQTKLAGQGNSNSGKKHLDGDLDEFFN